MLKNINKICLPKKFISTAEEYVNKTNKTQITFSNLATSYTRMFDFGTFGFHRIWKNLFVKAVSIKPNMIALDVAGGTGDIAIPFIKKIKLVNQATDLSKIHVCDINKDMMEVGKKRAKKLDIETGKIIWEYGDAHNLPYKDNFFDVYLISSGIKYCTDIKKVLHEAHRVLKPNGQFLCIEMGIKNDSKLLENLYTKHFLKIFPKLCVNLSENPEVISHVADTVLRFPHPEQFKQFIAENSRFKNITCRKLKPFGFAAIYTCTK